MMVEILKNLFKVEIPLLGSPLKALNSYVIKSSERNLIIDTGWNREECMKAMHAGLKKLGVDLKKTDFFITHLHADHIGLVWNLVAETATVYFNEQDANWYKTGDRWDDIFNFARASVFPESDLQEIFHKHPGYKYGLNGNLAFHILKEGDIINIGEYVFTCVETPGHTRGHMCLYELEKKVLVSGDHILSDITPNIQLWSDERNPLEDYLASLDKVYRFDIDLVLPGHRRIFANCKERIQELKHHHQRRVDEVLSILQKEGSMNAFQVASRMSWDIIYDSWNQFPITQKWFATGEAIAHLKYLAEKGMVKKEMRGENIVFSLNKN